MVLILVIWDPFFDPLDFECSLKKVLFTSLKMSWFDSVLEGFYRIIVLRPPRMSFFCGRVLDGFYKISVLRPSSDELIGRVLDGSYKISLLRPPRMSWLAGSWMASTRLVSCVLHEWVDIAWCINLRLFYCFTMDFLFTIFIFKLGCFH